MQHLPGHPFAGAGLQATGYALHNKMLLAMCCASWSAACAAKCRAPCCWLAGRACSKCLQESGEIGPVSRRSDWHCAWSCRSAFAAHWSSPKRVRAAVSVFGHAPAGLRRLRGARVGRCTLPQPGAGREGASTNASQNGAAGRGGARVSAIPHKQVHKQALRRHSGFCDQA